MSRARVPLGARFQESIDKSGDRWEWVGTVGARGYGQICEGGRQGRLLQAHRVSYEVHKGPIPEGLVIDHMCHNKTCVNPDHLRAVTQKQNVENVSQNGRADNKSSGVRGVSWNKRRSLWHASVGHKGKLHYAGSYADLEDAKRAVVSMRLELHTHNDADRLPA